MSSQSKCSPAGLVLAYVFFGLAGCGGGDSAPNLGDRGGNPNGGTPPEKIQGIATPASVAVVTATNAE